MKLMPHEILQHLGLHVPAEGIEIEATDGYRHATLLRLLGRQMRVSAIADQDLELLLAGMRTVMGTAPSHTSATPPQLDQLRASLTLTCQQVFGFALVDDAWSTAVPDLADELKGHDFDFAKEYDRHPGQILSGMLSIVPIQPGDAQYGLARERLQQLLTGRRSLFLWEIYADFLAQPHVRAFADAIHVHFRPTEG